MKKYLFSLFYKKPLNLSILKLSIVSISLCVLSLLMFGCVEKDDLARSTDALTNDALTNNYSLNKSITEYSKAEINTSLFDIEMLDPKLRKRVENIQLQHSKSLDDFDSETIGYPLWGATMGNEKVSVIPTLRSNMTLSYEFLVVLTNELEQQKFVYVNSLDNENPVRMINILTFPILTEQSQQDLFGLGGTTLIDLEIEGEGWVSENGTDPNDCFTLTFYTEHCISVHQDGVGDLCCRCEEHQTTTIRCNDSGGGVGVSGVNSGVSGVSSSGNGVNSGVSGVNSSGNGPNTDDFIRYLDSMINNAPDQIINNVDCEQNPCLCDVINRFSENPNNYENLSNEVSHLLQEIFSMPNYLHLTITTSDLAGTSPAPDVIATSSTGTNGSFPISGMAYSEIIFNSNYQLSCTKAHLASTLLHESMHAYIHTQRAALSPADFAALYPMYSTGFDPNNSHHIAIANNYITALTQSLQNMFPNISPEAAEALTWEGLQSTPAYSALLASQPPGFEAGIGEIINTASCQGPPVSPQELNALGLESCF